MREKKVILVDAPPSCVHSHHSWEDGKKEERAISNGSISCRRRGSPCLCHNNTFCDRFTRLEDRFERKIVLTTFTSTSSKSVVAYVVALLLCSQQESKHHAPSTYSSIAVAFLLYVCVCVFAVVPTVLDPHLKTIFKQVNLAKRAKRIYKYLLACLLAYLAAKAKTLLSFGVAQVVRCLSIVLEDNSWAGRQAGSLAAR